MNAITEARPKPFAQLDSRMLTSGLDPIDFLDLHRRCIDGGEDWPSTCEEIGDRHCAYAKAELEKGHRETAAYFYFAAQAVYRVGQYGIMDPTDEKIRIYRKLDESFHEYAKNAKVAHEKVAIPYKDFVMDGWLVLPDKLQPSSPVVLMIPGASGFKEEFYPQALNFVERGYPVLLMDGPGQGTTLWLNKGYLEIEVEHAYHKMVDFLEADPRFGTVAVIGGSTGGYYVARAAATDPRIKACVWNSGSYHPQEIVDLVAADHHRFALLYGVSDEEMTKIWPDMTLKGLAEKITCPILLVHGGKDDVFKIEGVQKTFDEVQSVDKELKIYEDAWHYQMGIETAAFRYMADWLVDRLKRA